MNQLPRRNILLKRQDTRKFGLNIITRFDRIETYPIPKPWRVPKSCPTTLLLGRIQTTQLK
jgi:hypothetical protein